MKKFSVLVALLLIVGMLTVSAFAAQTATVTVSTSSTDVHSGDTFTVTVDVSSVANCIAGGFMFNFNTDVFEYVSGSALVDGFAAAGVSTTNGNLAGYFMGNTVNIEGSIFQITLKVKDNAALGNYTISGAANLVSEINGVQEDVSCTVNAATITVACKHADENNDGACDSCGEELIKTDSSLVLYKTNTSGGDLLLGDDIRASFIVNAKGLSYDEIYLEITMNGVTTIARKLENSTATTLRYAYVIPAAHMTTDITVTVYGVKGDETYRGEVLTYSVRNCVEAKMASWITNPAAANQCKLLMSMLHYGEKAQLQFSINTDKLATAGLPQNYLDLIPTTVPTMGTMSNPSTSGMKITKITQGLMLQEKVKVSTVFTASTAFTNYEDVTIEVKHHRSKQGDVVTYTYTSADTDYVTFVNSKNIRFYFDKVAPSQLRDELEFTVYENGVAVSATYVRSVDMITNQANYINNMPDLIYAIMNYADAAKTVFG